MNSLVTLSKNSPEFESYLLGTFDAKKRALPVRTLNVNSASETVTFRIVDTEKISRPSPLKVIVQALKIRSYFLILMPLFLVLVKNMNEGNVFDPWAALFVVIGLGLAFASANLRNDYLDHMKGLDRVLGESGSRAIQNGWMTAAQVKSLSNLFLGLALLCAFPLIVAYPEILFVVAVALAVGLWAQFQKQNSFKYQIGGELAIFLLLGPLLTLGAQMAMGGNFDLQVVLLGALWGWAVLFVVHLRNFRHILPSLQAGFSNTVNWLGFDKARRLLAVWWGFLVVFNFAYYFEYADVLEGTIISTFLVVASIPFVKQLKSLASPVGSEMKVAYSSGIYLFLLAMGLWIVQCLWSLI